VLSKSNLVQKTSKSDDLKHFSIIMSHSVLSCTHSVGNKTKSIRPRLRPRPKLQDQDQDYKTKTKTVAGLRPVLSQDRGLRLQV